MKKLNQLSGRDKTKINTLLRAGKCNEEISSEMDCTVRAVRMIRHSLRCSHNKKLRGGNKNHCPSCGGFWTPGTVCKKVNTKGEVCNYNPGKFPVVKNRKNVKKLCLESVEEIKNNICVFIFLKRKNVFAYKTILSPMKSNSFKVFNFPMVGVAQINAVRDYLEKNNYRKHKHSEGVLYEKDLTDSEIIELTVKIKGLLSINSRVGNVLEEITPAQKSHDFQGAMDEAFDELRGGDDRINRVFDENVELKQVIDEKNILVFALARGLLLCVRENAELGVSFDELVGDLEAMRETAKGWHLNLVKEEIQNSKLDLSGFGGFRVGDVVKINPDYTWVVSKSNDEWRVVKLIDTPIGFCGGNIIIENQNGLKLSLNTRDFRWV